MTSATRADRGVATLVDVICGRRSGAAGQEALTQALGSARPVDGHPGHLILELPDVARTALAETFPAWVERGFVRLRVKAHPLAAPQLTLVDTVVRVLRQEDPATVPHASMPGHLLSLDLPGARSLRDLAAESDSVASRAVDAGLWHLGRHRDLEPRLREELRLGGSAPWAFPVAGRYIATREKLARTINRDLASQLPDEIDDAPGHRVLFWDPKPANLVLAPREVAQWRSLGHPFPAGVDYDLIHYESSYALQAILAAFSAPLPRDPAVLFARRARLHELCSDADTAPEHVDRLLLYHLMRNYLHGNDSGDRAKAMAFAEAFLSCAPALGIRVPADGKSAFRSAVPAGAAQLVQRRVEGTVADGDRARSPLPW
jgi:hypothetical protein